jgi:PAS domain S-box-containing protein
MQAEAAQAKASGIVGVTVTLLGLVLLSSMADRQFSIHITRQQQAQSALTDSERTYGLTFDAAPIGIAHVGLDGRWLRVNERLCNLLGWTADQLTGTDVRTLTHPDDGGLTEQALHRMRKGLIDRQVLQQRYRRGDGQYVWTASRSTRIATRPASRPTSSRSSRTSPNGGTSKSNPGRRRRWKPSDNSRPAWLMTSTIC